ncbi:hypothetical protein M409DRAFT_59065 [Zasmidium cellare ATCC 36951]|uniref:Uncharacterized protein n=1 Tax=Zasmidium cellare ATCC 36951 TaxID=1080233 RepID=A0A6A6C3H3_ZASCE|nr:uncharacterized protein M409DRAFT_59065 [Zasmidium cellare ATCC 36951]KAF2161687.1 hypothetical protein M409DRAFT_59065 [Zasmidium cellare ATCC 36951]
MWLPDTEKCLDAAWVSEWREARQESQLAAGFGEERRGRCFDTQSQFRASAPPVPKQDRHTHMRKPISIYESRNTVPDSTIVCPVQYLPAPTAAQLHLPLENQAIGAAVAACMNHSCPNQLPSLSAAASCLRGHTPLSPPAPPPTLLQTAPWHGQATSNKRFGRIATICIPVSH